MDRQTDKWGGKKYCDVSYPAGMRMNRWTSRRGRRVGPSPGGPHRSQPAGAPGCASRSTPTQQHHKLSSTNNKQKLLPEYSGIPTYKSFFTNLRQAGEAGGGRLHSQRKCTQKDSLQKNHVFKTMDGFCTDEVRFS